VLVCPSLLTPASRHHENLLRFPWWPVRPVEHMLALPAVPLLGFQVVGGYGCDRVTIAVAEELEKMGVAKAVTPFAP
jgi:hypothetical protein